MKNVKNVKNVKNDLKTIETDFINFFNKNGFEFKYESPLIPKNTVNLLNNTLFTIAGMLQFKDKFTSSNTANTSDNVNKILTSQSCIRTVDLDIIGEDNIHLSLFKMLGTFVFNYSSDPKFLLSLILDFLLQKINLDKNKLIITYPNTNLQFKKWWNELGIEDTQLIEKNNNENIWKEGEIGLFGECTEIFYPFSSDLLEIANIVLINKMVTKD